MLVRTLLLLLSVVGSAAAAPAEKPSGPALVDLMNLPNYAAAWKTMIGDTTVPDWLNGFAKTLDGPAIPSIDLLAGGKIYTLGFTCKPNDCGENQLYVLFNGDGSQAWGMLVEGERRSWLGAPDEAIQEAIRSRVEEETR
jgi:hypothetical protein